MALVPSTPPAPPIQRASTAPQLQAAPAAAPEATPAAEPDAAAAPDKPAPAKRRAHPKRSDESYVPY
jgi:hypothetical protein